MSFFVNVNLEHSLKHLGVDQSDQNALHIDTYRTTIKTKQFKEIQLISIIH